jgi:hypothetical protein
MNDSQLEAAENMTSPSLQRPKVITSFLDYAPPFDVVPIVERMLASVPAKYLVGLSEVVLTNSSGLSRKMRRSVTKARKKNVRIVEARGLYRQAWQGKPAWIQIFVDNTLARWRASGWLRFAYTAESEIGDVLFHEIGHHIHFTTRPEFREKEDVADVWMVRLRKHYFRVRHPFLRAITFPIRPLARFLSRAASRALYKKGLISRGEFEESTGNKKQ